MDRDPKQPIIGRCSLWINDIELSKSYWILLLTDYGIYDNENEYIQKVLNQADQSNSLIPNPFRDIQGTRLEATLEFFMWLYREDKELCFKILKIIYEDFKDDEDVPEPYAYVDELENLEEGGGFPEVNLDDIVPATPRVYNSGDELEFYYQTKNIVSQATDEVFIIDAYANEDVIMYLNETSESVKKRILTQGKKEGLSNAAEKLVSNSDHRIEVRRNGKCHDRLIFVDDKCFAVGDSLHAAGTKPMYVVKFDATEKFCKPWDRMWENSQEYRVFED